MSKKTIASQDSLFFSLVFFSLILWVIYRSVFNFPVWFDESLGKALFFGGPVWIYISLMGGKKIFDTLKMEKLFPGLLLGLALGGIYGFAISLLGIIGKGNGVQPAMLFVSSNFWWQFLLALMTAFWESLFFFSFIMIVIMNRNKKQNVFFKLLAVMIIFTLFHIPNSIIRFSGGYIVFQVFLMSLFGLGQALLFLKKENFYSLVISHAIWGMVLLVHVM